MAKAINYFQSFNETTTFMKNLFSVIFFVYLVLSSVVFPFLGGRFQFFGYLSLVFLIFLAIMFIIVFFIFLQKNKRESLKAQNAGFHPDNIGDYTDILKRSKELSEPLKSLRADLEEREAMNIDTPGDVFKNLMEDIKNKKDWRRTSENQDSE